LLPDRDDMRNIYRGPSIDASYQVSVHLAKRFQRRRFFRNQLIRNKNCLWWPCLLTDRDEMSNIYRRTFHSIFASQGLRFGSPFSPPLADLEYILKFARNATWWFIEVAPLR
jgi:hypothetical protein